MQKKKLILIPIFAMVLASAPVSASVPDNNDRDVYIGDSADIDISGKDSVDVRYSGGDSSVDKTTDNYSSGTAGTDVEETKEEQEAYDARKNVLTSLKELRDSVPQSYLGLFGNSFLYGGTYKLSDSERDSIYSHIDTFADAVEDAGGYNSSTSANQFTKKDLALTDEQYRNLKEKLLDSDTYKNSTYGSVSNGSGKAGTKDSDASSTGLHEVPDGYGSMTWKDGKISLNNDPVQYGLRIGDFSNYVTDLFSGGIGDSSVLTDRYNTLQKYIDCVKNGGAGTSTSLEDIDDIAYVTAYTMTEVDDNYYSVSDYSSTKRKWQLKDENGKVVKSGEGDYSTAKLTFDETGKYTFESQQWAKETTGTAVTYWQRQYLVLIPTNTMLYYKEEECSPIVIDETSEYKWVTVNKEEFNVKSLGDVKTGSSLERIE